MKEFFNRIKEWFKNLFKKNEGVVEVKPTHPINVEVPPLSTTPSPSTPSAPSAPFNPYKFSLAQAYAAYRDKTPYEIMTKIYPAGLPIGWDWKEFDKVAKQPTHDTDGKPLDVRGNPISQDNFGPIPEHKVSVPGIVTLVYLGSPVTLAPVAGETNLKVGIKAQFFGSSGQTLAEVNVGSEGTQVHLQLKKGDSFTVQLSAPVSTVYWVKP